MTYNNFEKQLESLLRLHAPIKARHLAKILGDEFGKHVDRSDINAVLYQWRKDGKTEVDSDYQWSLLGAAEIISENSPPDSKVANSYLSDIPDFSAPDIVFTPEQQAIIDLDPDQHLLIRGQAGSGKTTVLAARAGKLLSATSKGSLLFLTYNSALCSYVKKSFSEAGLEGDIEVRTFHDWAKGAAKALGYNFSWVDGKQRTEQLKRLIPVAAKEMGDHRFYDQDNMSTLLPWWGEEIAWLFGQHVTRLNEYLTVDRIGRGTTIRVPQFDRRFIWQVFELYQEWLEESNQEDYDNPAGQVLRALLQGDGELDDSFRFDHVFVDEVQDFDKSWLLALAKVPRLSLSLAGDLAQKIYRRNFTWSSVGIKVQGGRSRRLYASHRTTRQIMEVAGFLLKDNDIVTSEDYVEPEMPRKAGDKVRRIIGSTARDAYDQGYQFVADQFKRLRKTTVVVALPFSRQLYPAQKALEERGLTVQRSKGAGLGCFDGGVVVTTYHQLKGLEFDHVVIMGLHDSQFPGRFLDNIGEEDVPDEENLLRRVLYVAMTRARQSVTLVGSDPFCRFYSSVPGEYFIDCAV
jgi:superfamily I DNA/RNA helicase